MKTYLLIFYTFFGVLFFLFSIYSKIYFSIDKLKLLIYSRPHIFQIENPCKFTIAAIPDSSPNYDVKFNLYCKTGKSINIISLKSIQKFDFRSIVNTLSLINNFDGELLLSNVNQWKCTVNNQTLSPDSIIKALDEINCEEI